MTKKTKGWLMIAPLIVIYLVCMINWVGWVFLPILIGCVVAVLWLSIAVSLINSKD